MTSVPDFLLIETAFTIVQWTLVAPLTVLTRVSLNAERTTSRDVIGGIPAMRRKG